MVLLGWVATAPAAAQTYPKCSQDHPGRQHRLESLAKKGDAKMAKSVARHTVAYAIERYGLKDLVTPVDVERANDMMYSFLKWKLGNPSAIAGQFASTGYQHFDKGYVDEAGAVLMGFEVPQEKDGHSMFYLPPELLKLWDMSERLKNSGKAYLLQTFWGVPAPLTLEILNAYQDQKLKVARHLGFNIPKKYDFPNGMLLAAIEARRNPEQARLKFERQVEEASRHEQDQTSNAPPGQPTAPSGLHLPGR